MKKILLIITVLFTTFNSFAQNRSINFIDCSLDKAMEMAKEQNKPLFVDCYTSWCGPCKIMAKDVFTIDAVADYFNENFICVKFDCEKGEGPKVASTYKVSGYPTFLIIDNNRELIHTIVGSRTPEAFVAETKKGLDPEQSMYGKKKKFESKKYDVNFLISYFKELKNISDRVSTKDVGNEILAMKKESELFTKEMWDVVSYYYISGYGSKWWNFILENSDKYVEIVGERAFKSKISETMHPFLFGYLTGKRTNNKTKEDFEAYKNVILKYDLENADLLLSFLRMGYSRSFDNFNKFFKTVETEYKTLDKSEHYRVMVNIIDHLVENVTPRQKERLYNTLKRSEETQTDYFKSSYKQLYDKLV